MKLTHLEIKDFRSIESMEWGGVASTVAIFGNNAAGKSSILDAIRMLLIGRCEYTAANGAGSELLIREGARCAQVSGVFTFSQGELAGKDLMLSITINRKGTANEWDATDMFSGAVLDGIPDRATLWHKLGIWPRVAWAALMPGAFISSKESSDILAEYAMSGINVEALRDSVARAGMLDACRSLFKASNGMYSENNLEDWISLGDVAYGKRTEANSELKKEKAYKEDMGFIAQPKDAEGNKLDAKSIKPIESKIKKLSDRRDALNIELGAAQSTEASEAVNISQMEIDSEKLAHEITELAKVHDLKLAEHGAKSGEHDAARAELIKIDEEISRIVREEEEGSDTIEFLKEASECPTCKRKISKDQGEKLLESMRMRLAGLKSRKEEISKKEQDLGAKTRKLGSELDALFGELRETSGQVKTLRAQKERLDAQIAEGEKKAEARGTDVIQGELDALNAELEKGKKLLESLRCFDVFSSTEKRIELLTEETKTLDWITKAFKDGEHVRGLMADELGTFEDAVNEHLSPFGYEVETRIKGKAIDLYLVTIETREGRHVRLCSKGQRAVMAYATASAFGRGGVSLIDDVNDLDGETRKKLLRDARANTSGTIVIAGAWQQANPNWPRVADALNPIQTFVADGGVVLPASEVLAEAVAQ